MSEVQMNLVNEETVYEQPGLLKRILWVFTSPGKLMACLAEKPRILLGLILSLVSLDALYLTHMPLYQDMLRNASLAQIDYMESLGVTMTPEMIEASLPQSMITGLISTPIAAAIMWLVITLVLFAVLKIMGGQGKFKAYLSVTGYASVISAAYMLIALVAATFTGSLHVDPTLTSLATLVSKDSVGTVVYALLKSIDIFSIWYYVVMAIGLAAVSKVKKSYVYIAVASVFVISVIIAIVGAIATQGMM
jgi:hypothetical protein